MAKKATENRATLDRATETPVNITGYDSARANVDGGLARLAGASVSGDDPAIIANLALANQIANDNIAQQNAIQFQQAMFQLQLAAVAKCAELILSINPADPDAAAKLEMYKDLMDTFMEKFNAIPAMVNAKSA